MFDFKPFFLSEGFIPQAKPETMIAGKFLPSKLTKPRLKFGGENEELFLSFVRTITPPPLIGHGWEQERREAAPL